MSKQTRFYKKVLGGKKQPHGIFSKIESRAGVPSWNALHVGQLCENATNGDWYIATNTTGTWVKINA